MHNSFIPSISSDLEEVPECESSGEDLWQMIHSLGNKLLPITVFSQLALRHNQDPGVLKHLQKIHQAAEEARSLVVEIQRHDSIQELSNRKSSSTIDISTEN